MVRGFLCIDKPAGITSFDVVRRVRRAASVRRVGHAGTLDPNATGVLPIAIGEATRLVDELVGAGKRYRAEVVFGIETDSYDVEGAVVAEADASAVDEPALRTALAPYRGEILQRPPAFSAVKREGVPAYRAARQGAPLDLEPRPVTVYSVEILEFDRSEPSRPRAVLDVRCGKGFYVRSLAYDVGVALGVGAHLAGLRRTQVGPFLVEEAVPLDTAVRLLEAGECETLVHAADMVLTDWPAVILDAAGTARVRRGMDVLVLPREGYRPSGRHREARAYDSEGGLVGLLRPSAALGTWHPYRVFADKT